MNAGADTREARGLSLLAAHCLSFEPDAPSARQRLDEAVGPELAHKLFTLCTGVRDKHVCA
jgi:hypothetical protein